MKHKHDPKRFLMADPEMYEIYKEWANEFSDLTTFEGVNYSFAFFMPFCCEMVCAKEEVGWKRTNS